MTGTVSDLRNDALRLDGRPYGAYRDLGRRPHRLGALTLTIEHVQGDPFAAPSRVRIDVAPEVAALPPETRTTPDQRRAAADFLQRALARVLGGARVGSGSGKSGRVAIAALGQEVLERSAVRVREDGGVVVRLTVGLPATGRRILGRDAADLLAGVVPGAVETALAPAGREPAALATHLAVVEDQVALRQALGAAGLVAFLAEGARLPRRSGADDRPMADAVALDVPDGLAVRLDAPHAGPVRGLAVPRGVTLVVGGGYHGKSTVLSALARGVYDHVPGDGRERCVTCPGAVTIRAEDGRSVRAVDLRPFISHLPLGRDTARFDTDDASGSTSQAAAIVEAIEAGADALLVDEDTAATNFMIRDARMRRLVAADAEPITPFLDRVRQLADERGVSSVLVIGGAGDYLDVADTVIQMDEYRPRDVTAAARAVAAALPLGDAAPQAPGPWPPAAPRIPDPTSLDAGRGRRERARAVRTRTIELGDEEIDVSLLAQLVDPAQARFVADALLLCARGVADGRRSVAEILDALEALAFEELAAPTFGDRAAARRYEIAATLGRLRALRIR
jgi:predicted ABC-class ATPase